MNGEVMPFALNRQMSLHRAQAYHVAWTCFFHVRHTHSYKLVAAVFWSSVWLCCCALVHSGVCW